MKESALEAVHEAARDLHEAGVMDDVTMRKFDLLCLPPIKQYTPGQIKRIRIKTRTNQDAFAVYLNTSKHTIQKWEHGIQKPNRASLKLLNIVDRKGLDALV